MQSVLYALAVKFLDRDELAMIKERIGMTVLGKMLFEDGVEKGIEKGIEKGVQQGLGRANALNVKLADAGRADDIIRAASDRTYQEQLFKEMCIRDRLCDDNEIILEGLSRQIDWEGLGICLSGTAADGQDAWNQMKDNPPDILITCLLYTSQPFILIFNPCADSAVVAFACHGNQIPAGCYKCVDCSLCHGAAL